MEMLNTFGKLDYYKQLLFCQKKVNGTKLILKTQFIGATKLLFKNCDSEASSDRANTDNYSETKKQQPNRKNMHYTVIECTWFRRIFNPHKLQRIRQSLISAFVIILIGIIAGTIAAYIDAESYKISKSPEKAIYAEQIDRLIRAVELDWGR